MARRRSCGFTLIELVTVILILSIVSIGVTSYIRFGIDIYRDSVGRDRQIGDSRFLIERISRELREALPNSVRVGSSGDGSTQCIEFVPIVASSSYVDIPVTPDAAAKKILVVAPAIGGGTKISVYPLSAADIYANVNQNTGKTFALNAVNNLSGQNVVELELQRNVLFGQDSPTERYFLIDTAVSYCADGSEIRRYGNYWRSDNSFPPSAGGTGVLMAQRQTNKTPFTYQPGTLIRNSVAQLDFKFSYDDEKLNLYHEVHIVNVP